MPLPLLFVIPAIASLGTVGVVKSVKALADNSKAKDLNNDAKDIIEKSKKNLKKAQTSTQKSLELLGEKKLYICENTLSTFIKLFEKIKNVEFQSSSGLDELKKFKLDAVSFAELKQITELATSFSSGALSGAVAGGAVALGAYGAAGTFAVASTGTAIASLSGAAATNATLAFFGGGSLAAGGLGIAGGTMVLGGLVAGPALAVLGIVMGAKASANLDNAYSNLAKAKQTKEEVAVLVTACNGIMERANLFYRILMELDLLLYPLLQQVEDITIKEGNNYSSYSVNAKKSIAALLSTVQATKAMIDTPIIDVNGAITQESEKIAAAVQKQIANA